jgi:hypothetical protein
MTVFRLAVALLILVALALVAVNVRAVSPRVAIDGEVIYIPEGVTVTLIGGNPEVTPSPTNSATPSLAPSSTPSPTPSPPTPTPLPSPIASPTPAVPSATPSDTAAPSATSPTTTPQPTPGTDFIGPDVSGLPTSGTAWNALKAAADANPGTPNITCDQNQRSHPGAALASALVYARTGDTKYRTRAIALIEAAYPTARTCSNAILSLGRQLGAYVLAADYVGYRDFTFIAWLDDIRTRDLGGHGRWYTLKGTADDSSNNWHSFAQASLVAANAYLGASLAEDWARFRGFTGDTSAYVFRLPSSVNSTWTCAGSWTPVQVCPGDPRHGAIAEDAWRSGNYPNISKTYVQESMQGLALTAEILTNAGYPAWALLQDVSDFATRWGVWNASAVGQHVPWIYNARLGAGAPTKPAGYGRTFGYTDWLYGQ